MRRNDNGIAAVVYILVDGGLGRTKVERAFHNYMRSAQVILFEVYPLNSPCFPADYRWLSQVEYAYFRRHVLDRYALAIPSVSREKTSNLPFCVVSMLVSSDDNYFEDGQVEERYSGGEHDNFP